MKTNKAMQQEESSGKFGEVQETCKHNSSGAFLFSQVLESSDWTNNIFVMSLP